MLLRIFQDGEKQPPHRQAAIRKNPTLADEFFVGWWRRGELAILASQRTCMCVGVRRLAAVLLEFPAHPPSVPDVVSIPPPTSHATNKNGHPDGQPFLFVGGGGGNWPCRPRIRLQANAAPGYKQHAGAVCLTPSAPRPWRTRFQFPHNFNATNRNDTTRVSFLFDGGGGGN